MTDGYDLCLLVMTDCMLQALLMISKCVNYSLLRLKDFLSSFRAMEMLLGRKTCPQLMGI